MPRFDQRLAVEMLITITERMKARAEGRKRLTAAESRRKERSRRKARLNTMSRGSIAYIDDEEYGEKPPRKLLKDALREN